MARPAKYEAQEILDAALEVFAGSRARDVSAAAVARHLGAPSGSIYYRFASRDLLLATLWLRSVERFQHEMIERFDPVARSKPKQARERVVECAVWVVAWARRHPAEARLLLHHRREDLIDGPFPESLRRRARQLRDELDAAFATLLAAVGPRVDARLLRFSLTDIPGAAIRRHLARDEAIPPELEAMVERAARGALASGA